MFERSTIHHLTPVGWLTLRANHAGLTGVEFGKIGDVFGISIILTTACTELDEYFSGERQEFSVPLMLNGTPFQKKVWDALRKIPYGAIPSYSDIADEIGRPCAGRAVGMANNKNPIPIFIPCHRVIGRDGSLTGYAGGLDIKRKLLDMELKSSASGLFETKRTVRRAQLELLQ